MSTAAGKSRIVPCAPCGAAMEEYSAYMRLCLACLAVLGRRLEEEAKEGKR